MTVIQYPILLSIDGIGHLHVFHHGVAQRARPHSKVTTGASLAGVGFAACHGPWDVAANVLKVKEAGSLIKSLLVSIV